MPTTGPAAAGDDTVACLATRVREQSGQPDSAACGGWGEPGHEEEADPRPDEAEGDVGGPTGYHPCAPGPGERPHASHSCKSCAGLVLQSTCFFTHTLKFVITTVFLVQGSPPCCKRDSVNSLIDSDYIIACTINNSCFSCLFGQNTQNW